MSEHVKIQEWESKEDGETIYYGKLSYGFPDKTFPTSTLVQGEDVIFVE